jgi:hypothetical protein
MNPLWCPQQAGMGSGVLSSASEGAPTSSGGADANLAWLRRLHQAGAGGVAGGSAPTSTCGEPTAVRAVPDPERPLMIPGNGGSAPTGTQQFFPAFGGASPFLPVFGGAAAVTTGGGWLDWWPRAATAALGTNWLNGDHNETPARIEEVADRVAATHRKHGRAASKPPIPVAPTDVDIELTQDSR